jgi:hypothetical protein
MSQYTFTLTNQAISPEAFYFTIIKNFDLIDTSKYFDFTSSDGVNYQTIIIYTKVVLPQEKLDILTALVNNFTNPTMYFPGLNHIENYPLQSNSSTSQALKEIYTWVYPGNVTTNTKGTGNYVVNEIKTLIQYETTDVTQFTSISSNPTAQIQIYDLTRKTVVGTQTIDLTPIITAWQLEATNGKTGYSNNITSILFTDLWNSSANYDCIWQFLISVSIPGISIGLNNLQYICYNPPVFIP